jgi:hypothetical protein
VVFGRIVLLERDAANRGSPALPSTAEMGLVFPIDQDSQCVHLGTVCFRIRRSEFKLACWQTNYVVPDHKLLCAVHAAGMDRHEPSRSWAGSPATTAQREL